MSSFLMGAVTSLALGSLTVVHPCPLNMNIAVVSMLYGWGIDFKNKFILALLFVGGEIVTFTLLGFLISSGLLNIPAVSNFLQFYMRQLMGPVLIIAGMMVSGILLPHQHTLNFSNRFFKSYSKYGGVGSFILGMLVALSFCPMSAAMFFGVLIPLSVANKSVVLYPALFGVGSTIPLVLIVIFISRTVFHLERSFPVKKSFEKIIRNIAGITLILLGIFLSLRHIFEAI
ncbi:MAG: hypothetical protein GTN68_02410 [Candidatus Aminicenantes bacterium]|nr:hypothetical protein [Candidatus Aminicenantes bacterium]